MSSSDSYLHHESLAYLASIEDSNLLSVNGSLSGTKVSCYNQPNL